MDLNDLVDIINDENLAARAQQDNIALIVALQPWETSRIPSAICIVTTQLANGIDLEMVRVLQAEYISREIGRFNAPFHLPIILAGTMNALPSSDVYHLLRMGRRRPMPEPPSIPERPRVEEPSASSLTVIWTQPETAVEAPVLGYKISMRNCMLPSSKFQHEVEVPGNHTRYVFSMLSSGAQYQFRVAARNCHGWSSFSQPSVPASTCVEEKLAAQDDGESESKACFVVGDFPPQVKALPASYGSGTTPRFVDQSLNLDVCPRPFAVSGRAEEKNYMTLKAQPDRDTKMIHTEQLESAYGNSYRYICESEYTCSTASFAGTIDYIFHSSVSLVPFQLLSIPDYDELCVMGEDVRQQIMIEDGEWVRHRPVDWVDSLDDKSAEDAYMGKWSAPSLPNRLARQCGILPNSKYRSDHMALACVFAIVKDKLYVEWN